MSNNAASFIGDIPSHYDTGLGPNIFFDYADLIAKRAGEKTISSVVELAAGTGIVSRRLRDTLSPGTRLVVTDLNAPMLNIAKSKFSDTDKIEFTVANAMNLPFEDSEFDLIVCQFGVMFFPDKTLTEKRRVFCVREDTIYLTYGGRCRKIHFRRCT